MSELDLFGDPIPLRSLPLPSGEKKRQATKPNGYAAPPGTGPKGQTCKTCRHLVRHHYAKTYLKCFLLRHKWTNGPGSDIRAGAPACRHWASIVQCDNDPIITREPIQRPDYSREDPRSGHKRPE